MLNEQTIVKWDKNAETDLRNGLTKAQVKDCLQRADCR